VTSDWIENFNLANSQPAGIVSMLKWLRVTDESGQSLGVWNKIRVPGQREDELGKLVRASYSAIFEAVEVSSASRVDLEGAFISAYSAGAPGRLVNCFLALCRHAGIDTAVATRGLTRSAGGSTPAADRSANGNDGAGATPEGSRRAEQQSAQQKPRRKGVKLDASSAGVSVNLNVEIPAEWTEDQIRARIAAVTRALEPADAGDS
jgi:Family of unknown function (DUF5343)